MCVVNQYEYEVGVPLIEERSINTQAGNFIRYYWAIQHPEEEEGKNALPYVWSIYFACVPDHQRWDVAYLASTIQDG
jgi:hypothetical protein